MLYMVVERFKGGDPTAVGERFRLRGRMMPEEVTYLSSWIAESGAICYQLMEAPNVEAFRGWTDNWDDIMEFEIVPVLSSADFWARRQGI